MLGDVPLWITEGGYDMEDPGDPDERARQAEALVRGHAQCAAVAQCMTVAQHTINDVAADGFKSGLRDDFDVAAGRPGPPRPAAETWAALPL
jgi:transposase